MCRVKFIILFVIFPLELILAQEVKLIQFNIDFESDKVDCPGFDINLLNYSELLCNPFNVKDGILQIDRSFVSSNNLNNIKAVLLFKKSSNTFNFLKSMQIGSTYSYYILYDDISNFQFKSYMSNPTTSDVLFTVDSNGIYEVDATMIGDKIYCNGGSIKCGEYTTIIHYKIYDNLDIELIDKDLDCY